MGPEPALRPLLPDDYAPAPAADVEEDPDAAAHAADADAYTVRLVRIRRDTRVQLGRGASCKHVLGAMLASICIFIFVAHYSESTDRGLSLLRCWLGGLRQ